MKITLMIEGSASTIAAILANLPGDASHVPNAPSTSIGTGTPVAPAFPPSVPNTVVVNHVAPSLPTMPLPTTDADDEGDADEGTPTTDSTGLPWDERIHSKGANRLNADGTWRKRRGVDAGLVAQVEAELRGAVPAAPIVTPVATMPIPAPIPMPMPVSGEGAPTPPTPLAPVAAPMPVGPAAAPATLPATPPLAPAAAPTHGEIDFGQFMQRMAEKMQTADPATGTPVVDATYLAAVAGEISTAFNVALNAITDIASNPQMITYAVQILQRDQKW